MGEFALVCNGQKIEFSYEEMVNLISFVRDRAGKQPFLPGYEDDFYSNNPEWNTMVAKCREIWNDSSKIPESDY